MTPRVAITTGLGECSGERAVHLPVTYADAVRAVGGEPLLLPPPAQGEPTPALQHLADALLLSGGRDLDLSAWGEPLPPAARPVDPRRGQADLAWLAAADDVRMPVLALCLGIQEMAVHRGGRLIQHLPDESGDLLDHGGAGRPRVSHPVHVEAGSLLAGLVGTPTLEVNSRHHQAVREPGRAMGVCARAPDGIIEAIEDPAAGRFFLGVQWHPEDLMRRPEHAALLEGLCRAAAAWRGGM